MRERIRLVSAALLTIILTAPSAWLPHANACGPFFSTATFISEDVPDVPIKEYIRGQLGLLQPSYDRSFQYVAWRYLSGKRLAPEEQSAVLGYWRGEPRPIPAPPPGKNVHGWSKTWQDYWMETASTVTAVGELLARDLPYGYGTDKQIPGGYSFFVNCNEDAFRTAYLTFQERQKQFGPDSAELREWTLGQHLVFRNCAPGNQPLSVHMPSAAKPEWHPLLKADRAYQIAAANFYSGQFEQAQELFEQIGRDDSSVWKRLGPYLAARALIRKATLQSEGDFDARPLEEAERRLTAILEDPLQGERHAASRRLLGFIRFRLRPAAYAGELGRRLLDPQSLGTRAQDMIDYQRVLRRLVSASRSAAAGQPAAIGGSAGKLEQIRREDELADWMLTFGTREEKALEHALDRWQQTRSEAWFIAAITHARAKDERTPELLEAARRVPPGSPAYISAMFHRLRLELESGNEAQVRKELDFLLRPGRAILPGGTRNLFLAQRMRLSRTLSEFLQYAPRTPLGFYDGENSQPSSAAGSKTDSRLFDKDAAAAFNRGLPLSVLEKAAAGLALPVHLRRQVSQMAWLRAVLLEKQASAARLGSLLADVAPETRPMMSDYLSARSAEERRFAAALLLLKFPGIWPRVTAGWQREEPAGQLNRYRENWWCGGAKLASWRGGDAVDTVDASFNATLGQIYPDGKIPVPRFVSEDEYAALEKEWSQLSKTETAPDYLTRIVIAWSSKNPQDPRVPEALHLAVRSTRYGCGSNETSKYSRQAFQLLHQKFPGNEWTKKTPYWF